MTDNFTDFKREFEQPTKEHQEREKNQKKHLEFLGKSQNCCVCLVDIVGSTNLVSNIPESKTSFFYSTFLNEMAEVVDDNNGKIVKSIGDALLFYFQDSEEGYLKNALNCGLEMVEKRQAINKKLLEKDIPEISYRVSSDFGKVMVGYSSVSVVEDIFGSTVNMCSKINPLANNNSMVIGNDFYNVAKMLGNFEFKEIKNNPRIGLDNKYPVFQVQRS